MKRTMMQRKAVIVGGGIGGLGCAGALARHGWDIEVLERAAAFTEVGAGLSLWSNGLRALDALGVGDLVRERSSAQAEAGIRDAAGRWLSRANPEAREPGSETVAMIHRAELLAVLHDALPRGSLRHSVTVREIRSDGTVRHSDGETRASLVVGADGIRSTARASIWPDTPSPRYAGYTAWRFVTPPVPVDGATESWGSGERFGYAPLGDGRVYCYAVANAAEGTPDEGLAGLRRRFGTWHSPIPALLEAADPAAVLHDDLYELPRLRTYVSGRVALAGDAAHAMTPDLGQGACQALEDAVVLAQCLDQCPDGSEALARYDRLRRKRTQMIARRAHRIGAVAQWETPAATALRNTVLRLLPRSSFARSLAPVLDWTP